MPRIIIFAPVRQDAIQFFAQKLAEADPEGIVVVTADFNLDQATAIIESMQALKDDDPKEG